MLKSILQKIALLAMVVSISGGLITGIEGAVSGTTDANSGIAVCGDLDSPVVKH